MSGGGFKQFRLEGIGTVQVRKNGSSGPLANKDLHPYLKSEFWQNRANQFWNSNLYSEESKRDLAMRANVIYTP